MVYHNLGSETNIGSIELRSLGQQVDLSEELAKDAIEGGALLLSAEEFGKCGFTPEELKKYAKPGPRMDAPLEFQAKYKAALMKVAEMKEAING